MNRSKKLFGIEFLIYDRIKNLVQTSTDYQQTKDKFWTTEINKELINLGEQLKYAVYTSEKKDKRYAEWLYDIIWSMDDLDEKNEPTWRNFMGLGLICEVEWGGYDNILEDFTKLTVGDADYRVMIVGYHDEKPQEDQWEDIKKLCMKASEYKFQNYKYLLIGLPWVDSSKIKFHSWIF